MENLTHTLLGWQLARLSPFQRIGQRAGIVGIIAANLPDADVLLYAVDRDLGTWQHRGFTHSVFGVPLMAIVGAAVTHRVLAAGEYRIHLGLWLAGLFSHALLDWPTTWGTQLLWPLSDHRFGLELIFIIDPMFWLLLGGLPWLLRKRGHSPAEAATIAIVAVLGWFAVAGVAKELAVAAAPEPVWAIPGPLAPWSWTGITLPVPGDPDATRYWLSPTSFEAAGEFYWLNAEQRAILSADPPAERDLWMRVVPVLHHDRMQAAGRELAVVDLAYTSWLSPDTFRFGGTYLLSAEGRVLERETGAVDGAADGPKTAD